MFTICMLKSVFVEIFQENLSLSDVLINVKNMGRNRTGTIA